MAVAKFRLWRNEPFHPFLRFKEIADGLWSARITRDYRTLARRKGDLVVWFWIGNHEDYDRLIAK